MLAIAINLDNDAASSFDDVSEDRWSYKYISDAVSENIINGIGNNMFGPELSLTREDMCVIFMRVLKSKNINPDNTIEFVEFTDYDDISNYAKIAVGKMQMIGVVEGREDNYFAPKMYLTRAEAAQALSSFLDIIYGKENNE